MHPATLIDLMRHGEPIGGRRYRGQIDDPLSELGWRQMRQATRNPPDWSAIVSSPLARCAAFAQELGERQRIPVNHDARLQEIGFGEWEGMSPDQLRERDPELLSRFYYDPVRNRPVGAEPLDRFHARVTSAFEDIVHDYQGHHVLVVAHAGVIRAVLAHVLNAPLEAMYRISVATATIVRIRADDERPPTLVLQGPNTD